MPVPANVRTSVLGHFGQRMLESFVRQDLGISSKQPRRGLPAREFVIYDLAERRVPRLQKHVGDAKLTWIRTYRGHVLDELARLAVELGDIKPRDPESRRAVEALLQMADDDLRRRAARLTRDAFEPRQQEARETLEDRPAPDRFGLDRALAMVKAAPTETLRHILVTVEGFGQDRDLLAALRCLEPAEDWVAELNERHLTQWTWPGAVREALDLIDFETQQARVLSELLEVTRGSHPDYVVLEYRVQGSWRRTRILRRAHVYEAKTGSAQLTAAQQDSFVRASSSRNVQYTVVHIGGRVELPRSAPVVAIRSRPAPAT